MKLKPNFLTPNHKLVDLDIMVSEFVTRKITQKQHKGPLKVLVNSNEHSHTMSNKVMGICGHDFMHNRIQDHEAMVSTKKKFSHSSDHVKEGSEPSPPQKQSVQTNISIRVNTHGDNWEYDMLLHMLNLISYIRTCHSQIVSGLNSLPGSSFCSTKQCTFLP